MRTAVSIEHSTQSESDIDTLAVCKLRHDSDSEVQRKHFLSESQSVHFFSDSNSDSTAPTSKQQRIRGVGGFQKQAV